MNITNKQIELLGQLGLTKNQTLLYCTSLQHGVLSVLELSKLTKLNRQQIYTEAEKLIELGLYDITRKNNKKFIAASPDKLASLAQKKIESVEELAKKTTTSLPDFKKLVSYNNDQIITKFFEGKNQIIKGYTEELAQSKNTQLVSISGSLEEMFTFLTIDWWQNWNNEFSKNKSTARMLVNNTEYSKTFAQKNISNNITTRYIDSFNLKVNIDVFNNTVFIVSFLDSIGIWLESPIIAQSYRLLFDALWQNAHEK